jgi:hypothetical protein
MFNSEVMLSASSTSLKKEASSYRFLEVFMSLTQSSTKAMHAICCIADVLEEPATSIFYPESSFETPINICQSIRHHTQKTVPLTVTAARTSNLKQKHISLSCKI